MLINIYAGMREDGDVSSCVVILRRDGSRLPITQDITEFRSVIHVAYALFFEANLHVFVSRSVSRSSSSVTDAVVADGAGAKLARVERKLGQSPVYVIQLPSEDNYYENNAVFSQPDASELMAIGGRQRRREQQEGQTQLEKMFSDVADDGRRGAVSSSPEESVSRLGPLMMPHDRRHDSFPWGRADSDYYAKKPFAVSEYHDGGRRSDQVMLRRVNRIPLNFNSNGRPKTVSRAWNGLYLASPHGSADDAQKSSRTSVSNTGLIIKASAAREDAIGYRRTLLQPYYTRLKFEKFVSSSTNNRVNRRSTPLCLLHYNPYVYALFFFFCVCGPGPCCRSRREEGLPRRSRRRARDREDERRSRFERRRPPAEHDPRRCRLLVVGIATKLQ